MTIHAQATSRNRMWKVAALLTTAAIMGSCVVSAAGTDNEPGRLPADIDLLASPMGEAADAADDVTPSQEGGEVATMWRIISLHRRGTDAAAADIWQQQCLPWNVENWKNIALAHTWLLEGNFHAAHEALDAASDDSVAAVVHYYRGLIRLIESERAADWNDAQGPVRIVTVSVPAGEVHPNSRGALRLLARYEFEQAIEKAPQVDWNQPLTGFEPNESEVCPPMAGDLLSALAADTFEATSHFVLAHFALERGEADQAEDHLNEVGDTGHLTGDAWEATGDLFADQGRQADAARAYAIAVGEQPGRNQPLAKMMESLIRVFTQ